MSELVKVYRKGRLGDWPSCTGKIMPDITAFGEWVMCCCNNDDSNDGEINYFDDEYFDFIPTETNEKE